MKLMEVAINKKEEQNPIQRQAIYNWCRSMDILSPSITDDLEITTMSYVNLGYKGLSRLPYKFSQVHGFFVSGNNFKSFKNFPAYIMGDFILDTNLFESFVDIQKHIKRITGTLSAHNNALTSHILGVFFIKDLRKILIDNIVVQNIVNKHLTSTRDVHACQEELIKAGFKEFAKI